MMVKIKRVDTSLPLPMYQTKGAAGFDFICREEKLIPPKTIERICANVIVQVPKGYMLVIASRSSTATKKGLMLSNSIGIIDQDYCGADDEIQISVYNFTESDVKIEKGDRIAQGIFIPITQVEFNEVHEIQKESRGGFGSTG